MKVYDLVIVGAGMMGSAAARHASLIPNITVCLVGPGEPKDRSKTDLFGCWFDEGRICYKLPEKHTWRSLAINSINRFRSLEESTGINFYTEIGYMTVSDEIKDIQNLKQICEKESIDASDLSEDYRTHFPFLNFPDKSFILYEDKSAGYISPRRLVEAQQKAASSKGVDILTQIVKTIKPASQNSHKWSIVTENEEIGAQNVLIAAGGFAGLKELFAFIKPGYQPLLELRTQTIAYLKLNQVEASRLKSMPTMVTSFPHKNLDGSYILPPIIYPDGNIYLKLGHGRNYEEIKSTSEEVTSWYRQQTGIPQCVDDLRSLMESIIPNLEVECVTGDGCLTSHTPDAEPYIDVIENGIGVCLGGNGYGAKSSDEIGRLASRLLMLNEWDTDIIRNKVIMKWKSSK